MLEEAARDAFFVLYGGRGRGCVASVRIDVLVSKVAPRWHAQNIDAPYVAIVALFNGANKNLSHAPSTETPYDAGELRSKNMPIFQLLAQRK